LSRLAHETIAAVGVFAVAGRVISGLFSSSGRRSAGNVASSSSLSSSACFIMSPSIAYLFELAGLTDMTGFGTFKDDGCLYLSNDSFPINPPVLLVSITVILQ